MVIKNDHDNCTWGEDRTPSQKEGKYSSKGRQNKYQSYCYEISEKWDMHEKGYKVLHFGHESA